MMKITGLTQLTIPDLKVSDVPGLTFDITIKQGETYSISQFCRYDPALLGPNADSLFLRDYWGTLNLQISHFRQEADSLFFQGNGTWQIDEYQLNHALTKPFLSRHAGQYNSVFHVTECCEFEIQSPRVTAGLYRLDDEEPVCLEAYFNRQACFRHRFGMAYETGDWLASDSALIRPLLEDAAQKTPKFVELLNHPSIQKLNRQIISIYGQSLKDFLGLL